MAGRDPLISAEPLFIAAGKSALEYQVWRLCTLPFLKGKKALSGWRAEVLEAPEAEHAIAEAWLKEQSKKHDYNAAPGPTPELLTKAEVLKQLDENIHSAFEKAVSRAASNVQRGTATLPCPLGGAGQGWALARLGRGGPGNSHLYLRTG